MKLIDEPVKESNKKGYVSFATSGENSRTTQMLINFADNANLDGMGFSPFACVVKGMEVVDRFEFFVLFHCLSRNLPLSR